MNPIILQCTQDHIPQLVELWEEYLADQGDDPVIRYIDIEHKEGYENILRSFLRSEPEGFLVALDGDEVIGFVIAQKDAFGLNYRTFEKIGNVQIIHTKRSYRRSGIASLLLDKALEYLRDNGCTVILSETDQHNTASLNLLLKHGFMRRGDHVTLYKK